MTIEKRALSCAVLALFLPAGGHLLRADPPTASPDRPRHVITVETSYPGASAQVVADTVAAPIEQEVNRLENILTMTSRATNDGRYTLHVAFEPGVDLTLAQVLVHNRIDVALPALPDPVKRRGVTVQKQSLGMPLVVALFSPDDSKDTLYLGNYTSIQIKDELSRVRGVGDVTLLGGQDYGMLIWLDPDRLASLNLTPGDVTRALRGQNLEVTGGQAGPGAAYTVSTPGRLAEPEQFAEVVLKTAAGGQVVRLRDVARVELGAGPSRGFARLDGKPVVALGISPTPQASPRELSAAVGDRMERLKRAFPEGIDYSLACDPTTPGCLLLEPVFPAGTSAERTRTLVERCDTLLMQSEGVRHVLALSENPFARFRDGPCLLALLSPQATKPAERDRVTRAVRSRLEPVDGAEFRLHDLSGPGGHAIDLAVRGPEAETVRGLAEKLVERLARSRKLTDVAANQASAPQPQRYLDVDRTRMQALGVALDDVNATLQVSLGSLYVNDFPRFGRTWQVRLQAGAPAADLAEGIKRLKVRGDKGQMVPLSNLVTVRDVTAAGCVDRLDFEPTVEVTASPAHGVSLAEARWLCETLTEQVRQELSLSPAYGLVWLQDLPAAKPIPGAEKADDKDTPPPEVTVSRPVVREVTDYEEFPGRTEAVQRVDLRARVSGYLDKVLFKEGTDVKKGDLLFEIDPRPYQAALDQAVSQVELNQAALKLARATYQRDKALANSAPGSVSPQQLDQDTAAVDEAAARLKAAQAGTEACKLNLDFTRVRAPVDGRIGRRLLDPGNLVKADETPLATLVSQDPLYVYFEVDERTLLRLRRLAQEGKGKAPRQEDIPVFVGLTGEEGFPRRGVVNFVDNEVNPDTGTLRARAVLPNPGGLLLPGLFVRVRLPVGTPHKALLVPDEAVGTDQGQKFVYVIDDRDRVVYRRVTAGTALDGMRVIDEGLQPGEHVIVGGWKRVRPALTVKPREAAPPAPPHPRREP